MTEEDRVRYVVNREALPRRFPTQRHDPAFWESLGRAVATFGFLEEVLCKAIFSFTATKAYSESEVEQAYSEWLPLLERTISDQLGGLIATYGKAVREHQDASIENLNELLSDLREASKIRNVLCHGSWGLPDSRGASLPFFVNRKKEVFQTSIDVAFLDQLQKHSCELACAVIETVTHMGWQFPGSSGPGQVIWVRSR